MFLRCIYPVSFTWVQLATETLFSSQDSDLFEVLGLLACFRVCFCKETIARRICAIVATSNLSRTWAPTTRLLSSFCASWQHIKCENFGSKRKTEVDGSEECGFIERKPNRRGTIALDAVVCNFSPGKQKNISVAQMWPHGSYLAAFAVLLSISTRLSAAWVSLICWTHSNRHQTSMSSDLFSVFLVRNELKWGNCSVHWIRSTIT